MTEPMLTRHMDRLERWARRWPCILVAIVCFLLAFTTSAHAECAWVLWRQDHNYSPTSGHKTEWATPLAYRTRAECVTEIATSVKPWERLGSALGPAKVEVIPGLNDTTGEFFLWGEADSMGARAFMRQHLHCLPDTVDPRGPKGK
jgi:hypothetical protein